jgi:quercetin dioxygenase-like cupin family protein
VTTIKTACWSTALAIVAFGAGILVAQTTTQSGREPQFANDEVRVWKSLVLPHNPLPLHRHDHPRVIIALTGGTMNLIDQNGGREVNVWQTGKAYWSPSMPPGALHQDVNVGDKPIEVMVVELEKAK